jgi:hypothetical protein
MKKVLKIFFTVVATLLITLLCLLLFATGPIAHRLIESVGSKALGTPVRIDQLALSLTKGELLLKGLKVDTLPGFEAEELLSLGTLDVKIDIKSLTSDTIIIHRILIDAPAFTYEQGTENDVITELMNNITAFSPPPAEPKAKPASTKPPPGLVIQQVEIHNLQLIAKNSGMPQLGTAFTIEKISFDSPSGKLRIHNTALQNPKSLVQKNLFSLDQLAVDLDWPSLFTTNIQISSIQLHAPHLYAEELAGTDTITEWSKLARTFTERAPKAIATAPKTAPEKTTAPQLTLGPITISDIKLHLIAAKVAPPFTAFSIEKVAVTPQAGTIAITNIALNNPPTFTTPRLFHLAAIDLKLDPDLFSGGTPDLQSLHLKSPHLTLEQTDEHINTHDWTRLVLGLIPPKSEAVADHKTALPATPPAAPAIKLGAFVIDDIQLKTKGITDAAPITRLSLQEISLNAGTGHLDLNELLIPNLTGFTAAPIFHLRKLGVLFDPETLLIPPLHILDITIDQPVAHLEQTADSGNIIELQSLFTPFIPPLPQTTSTPVDSSPGPAPSGPPVLLDHLTIRGLDVVATAPASKPENPPVTLPLIGFTELKAAPMLGTLSITNLHLTNPPGFANSNLVELALFSIDIDPESYPSDVVIIRQILIDGPTIAYERTLSTDNIKALQANIEAATMKRTEILDPSAEPAIEVVVTNQPEAPTKRVIINQLLVSNGMVKPKISALPTVPIPLMKIELKNIGKESEGATFNEAFSMVGTALYDGIIGAISGIGGLAGDAVKGAGGLTLDAGKAVTGKAGDTLGGAAKLTKGTLSGISNLVPGSGDKTENSEEEKKEDAPPQP